MKEEIESIMNKAFHTRRGESIIGVKEAAEEIEKLLPLCYSPAEKMPEVGEYVVVFYNYPQIRHTEYLGDGIFRIVCTNDSIETDLIKYWTTESELLKLLPKEAK